MSSENVGLLCSRSRSEQTFKISINCLSGLYLLNHRTFYNQTWYGVTHTWLPSELFCICSGKSWKSIKHSGNMDCIFSGFVIDTISCFKKCVLMIFTKRLTEIFVLELAKVSLGCFVQVLKTQICRFVLGGSQHMCKMHKVEEVSLMFPKRTSYFQS